MRVEKQNTGRNAVIFGVANDRSLAWAIAKKLNDDGFRVALGYQERNAKSVEPLLQELRDPVVGVCEFTDDASMDAFFERIGAEFRHVDALVHAAAFAKKAFLRGASYEITRSGFDVAMEVSVYSLPALVKRAAPLLADGASVMTLSYVGSRIAVPGYNVMGMCKAALESVVRYLAVDVGGKGVRVNAISAGPVATSAALAIEGFETILERARNKSPLKRNISPDDVANLALFLASDSSRNITGQIITIDAGESIVQ